MYLYIVCGLSTWYAYNPHTCMYVVPLFNMHINSYTFCPDRDMSGNDTSVM